MIFNSCRSLLSGIGTSNRVCFWMKAFSIFELSWTPRHKIEGGFSTSQITFVEISFTCWLFLNINMRQYNFYIEINKLCYGIKSDSNFTESTILLLFDWQRDRRYEATVYLVGNTANFHYICNWNGLSCWCQWFLERLEKCTNKNVIRIMLKKEKYISIPKNTKQLQLFCYFENIRIFAWFERKTLGKSWMSYEY